MSLILSFFISNNTFYFKICLHTFLLGTITDTSVVINKYYGTENVAVIIEFQAQKHVSYITTVTPDNGEAMRFTDVTTFNLTVSYNIRYEVSIMATLCQHNSFKNFELHYGELQGVN